MQSRNLQAGLILFFIFLVNPSTQADDNTRNNNSYDYGRSYSIQEFQRQQRFESVYRQSRQIIQPVIPKIPQTFNQPALNLQNLNIFSGNWLYNLTNINYGKNNSLSGFNLSASFNDVKHYDSVFTGINAFDEHNLNSYTENINFTDNKKFERTFSNAQYGESWKSAKFFEAKVNAEIQKNRRVMMDLAGKVEPERYLLRGFTQELKDEHGSTLQAKVKSAEYDNEDRLTNYIVNLKHSRGEMLDVGLNFIWPENMLKPDGLTVTLTNDKGLNISKEFSKLAPKDFNSYMNFLKSNGIPILNDEQSWIHVKDMRVYNPGLGINTETHKLLSVYEIGKNIAEITAEGRGVREEAKLQNQKINSKESVMSVALSAIGRAFRNIGYMLTGKWSEVKALRQELANQSKEKPTALYSIVKDKTISHLSLKELRNAVSELSKQPKEKVFTETIKFGNKDISVKLDDTFNLNPVEIKQKGDDILLKEPIGIENINLPEELEGYNLILEDAVFSFEQGKLELKEGIIKASDNRYYINDKGEFIKTSVIEAEYLAKTAELAKYKEVLSNANVKELKEFIAFRNEVAGEKLGRLESDELGISTAKYLVYVLLEESKSVDTEGIFEKAAFLDNNAIYLAMLDEAAGVIETAKQEMSKFKDVLSGAGIKIQLTEAGSQSYEIARSKLEELDYQDIQAFDRKIAQICGEMYEGGKLGDFIKEPTGWNIFGQVVVGLMPGIGTAGDARDVTANTKLMLATKYKEGKLGTVLAGIGCIPVVGEAAKYAGKMSKTKKILKASDKIIDGIRVSRKMRAAEKLLRKSGEVADVVVRKADDVNAELLKEHIKSGLKAKDFFKPYKEGTEVYEFVLKKPKRFVRAYDGDTHRIYGKWLDHSKTAEIDPGKFMESRALPAGRDFYAMLEVQPGARMRMGICAGGDFNGYTRMGGGIQYEMLENPNVFKKIYKVEPGYERIPLANDFIN